MKDIIINPMKSNGKYVDQQVVRNTTYVKGVYLHGKIHNLHGYDIVGIVGEMPKGDGVYPCKVLGFTEEVCTLFYWRDVFNWVHGLIVSNDDVINMGYAKQCYEKRTISV